MKHDPSLVVLGSRLSSILEMTDHKGEPEKFKAGLAVSFDTSGSLSFGGMPLVGISMGRSLRDRELTSVARVGNEVPLRLKDESASLVVGDLVLTSLKTGSDGNLISVAVVDVLEDGEAMLISEPMDPAIVVAIQAGVTTARLLAEALDASGLVSSAIIAGYEDEPQDAMASESMSGGVDFSPLPGTPVLIDLETGMASLNGVSTKSFYQSERKVGLYPDKTKVPCALVSLIGGF